MVQGGGKLSQQFITGSFILCSKSYAQEFINFYSNKIASPKNCETAISIFPICLNLVLQQFINIFYMLCEDSVIRVMF